MTKETAGRSLLRILKPPEPVAGDIFFEAGGSTFHTHTCPQGPHTWKCNSPYCNFLNDLCPDHDGPEPVVIGREPWKR